MRAALVNDLQRYAVLDGLAHRVLVDVVAKHLLGLVDRRARVADLGGVGDALVEVGPKQLVLRSVGLVGHDEDVGAGVQLREGLGKVRLAELVDHRHHQVGGVGAEQFLEPLDAVGQLHREADALTGIGQLLFQLGAVGDEDDLPVRELRVTVHLPNHEHHGERLAGALGVPDDAAALAGIAAFEQPLHRQLHRAELLIAADDLDYLALVIRRKQREGPNQVEQVVPVEHAGHETLLVVGAA